MLTTEQYLADATTLLYSSLEYKKVLDHVAELAIPYMADLCVIDIKRANFAERLSVASTNKELAQRMRNMTRFDALGSGNFLGPAYSLRTGKSLLVSRITPSHLEQAARSPQHLDELQKLGLVSGMCVPLIARNEVIGVISFGSFSEARLYTEKHVILAEKLARRAAIAIDNAMLYEKAQEAIRMRDEMLAIVSHDLKNPLTAIFISASFQLRLLDVDCNADLLRGQAENIKLAAQDMTRLISDLLDFARVNSGHLAIEARPVAVTQLLTRVRELHGAQAAQKSLRLQTKLTDPTLHAHCDSARVIQVLSNIIGNAIKFTPEGGSITVEAKLNLDNEIVFSVTDTGPGIATEQLPHVFDRYWQGKKTSRQSAGLGLSIARGIIIAHEGRIWVESAPGRGTTFYFTLKPACC